MDTREFEPWRVRFAEAFRARPDIEITKFSMELGKSKDYIARLIRRGTANPPPNLFIEICDKLEISPAYVISGDDSVATKEEIVRRVLEADTTSLRRIIQVLDLLEQGQGS